jgi:transcriptional activator cubitus interruptus
LNRRITDLKVDNPALSPPQTFARDTSPKLLELGQNYPNCHYQPTMMNQYNQQMNPQIRRDSNNSTTSSSYYSMKSCDISRRSSQQSHTSSMSTIRPSNYVNYDPQSFYDPISAGSSRRSSQLSTNEGGNYGPPSSQLLSSHLARLQRHSAVPNNHPYHSAYPYQQNQYYAYQQQQAAAGNYGNFFYNYNQHNHPQMMNLNQTPTSSTDRRMSEPISNSSRTVTNTQTVPRRPRSTTPTKSLETLLDPSKEKEKPESEASSPSKPHPNETVVLDVLKTNEKIENCDELVIPDEMVMYLNQVGDDTPGGSAKIKLDLDGEMSSSISIEKIKEEDLFELLAEADVKPDEDDESSNDSEINNNGECKTESDISGGKSRHILCKS